MSIWESMSLALAVARSITSSSRVWISKSLLHPPGNDFLFNTSPLLPSSSHVNLHLNSGETIKLCTEMLLNLIAAQTQIISGKSQTSTVFSGTTAHRKNEISVLFLEVYVDQSMGSLQEIAYFCCARATPFPVVSYSTLSSSSPL